MAHTVKSQSPPDVLIVGGGLIGLAIGWRAAQQGMDVELVEAREPGAGASGVAAGMLAPVTEADFGERALIDSQLEAARLYPEFVTELEQESGVETGYRACGTLSVATDRDELELLGRMHKLQRELGLNAERLSARELRKIEPGLAPGVTGGVHAPDDHQVSPRALLTALEQAFTRAGGVLRPGHEVTRVVSDGGTAGAVELRNGETLAAGSVVIAAGSWSGLIEGVSLPVRPVKGQILRLRGEVEQPVARRVIRTPEVYAVPRADGRLIVGATVEEQGFDTTVTAGAVLELLRRAYEVLPQIAELELVEANAGLRPTTPDNLPLIGRHPGIDGLFWATGHWRNGVLLAPLTAATVVELLEPARAPSL